MEKMQSLKVTTELSREETIVFLTQTRPLGFLSGLGVSIKGKGFLFPQGQCSTIVALMPAVCLVFLRRNLGSLGTSLKWKPPPFKIHMLELAHAWARAQLLLGTFTADEISMFSFGGVCPVRHRFLLVNRGSHRRFLGGILITASGEGVTNNKEEDFKGENRLLALDNRTENVVSESRNRPKIPPQRDTWRTLYYI